MSELLKEMCTMSGRLSTLINQTKTVEERKKIWSRYLEINGQIERLVCKEFDEDEEFYRETVDKIKDTETVINKSKENSFGADDVLSHVSNIIAHVEKIIIEWEIVNRN